MKFPSNLNTNFSNVPTADIPRSQFNRSRTLKTTFDAGYLIPMFWDEVLPGDTFTVSTQVFARLATPIVPVMDNIWVDTFFFFIPNRLVWTNWQKFMGEQTDPGDSTDYLVPTVTAPSGPAPADGFQPGSIYDYFGIPTLVPGLTVDSLWLRAYDLTWNTWFRDQNLQDSIAFPTDDGPDSSNNFVLQRRGKRHDYLASSLPWPQKGTAVEIPLGTTAPILRTSNALGWIPYNAGTDTGHNAAETVETYVTGTKFGTDTNFLSLDPNGGLYTDLTNANAGTINQLRQAFQLQKLYERDARGGTRYVEIIRAHFNVTSPDARLQNPEYLGGGQVRVNIHPIAQTSATDASTPQGNLAAMGTASGNAGGFSKSFTEHGVIIGLIAARADLNYQQGLNRMWSRQTKYDFYWPALAHIGEQAVLNKEIFAQGSANPTADAAAWGYQERYAEYRYAPNAITGAFRSNHPASLDIWHLALDFTVLPTLGSAFIPDNPPIDRIIATPDEPHFLADFWHQVKCARPMPAYSVPGLVDHF